MKIVCLCASNVKSTGENGATSRTCSMIEDYVKREHGNNIEVETVRFTDYDFKPCVMCGGCAKEGKCLYDDAFNRLFSKMAAADGIVLVCPHYATIPSKLMIVLEKLEEMAFISYCLKKESYALSGKPVAVIGHGGMTRDYEERYRTALLDTLAGIIAAVDMNVVGAGDKWPKGVVFGLKSLEFEEGQLFPIMEHDWENVSGTVTPLVDNLIIKMGL